jgi:hypothetical protein
MLNIPAEWSIMSAPVTQDCRNAGSGCISENRCRMGNGASSSLMENRGGKDGLAWGTHPGASLTRFQTILSKTIKYHQKFSKVLNNSVLWKKGHVQDC